MFATQERLHDGQNDLAMSKHSVPDPAQLQQEAFVLLTMLGVTLLALLSMWYTVMSSYRYHTASTTSKSSITTNSNSSSSSKEDPQQAQQVSRRLFSITILALIVQFWMSVHMLPSVGFATFEYPSSSLMVNKHSEQPTAQVNNLNVVQLGQNNSSGVVYMTRNLTTMGSFHHQADEPKSTRAQKRHVPNAAPHNSAAAPTRSSSSSSFQRLVVPRAQKRHRNAQEKL
jgi:hypothetical protein